MDRLNALGRGRSSCSSRASCSSSYLLELAELRPRPVGSFGQSAWDGLGGVIMGILTIVLIAWILADSQPSTFRSLSRRADRGFLGVPHPHHRDAQEPHRRLLGLGELRRRRPRLSRRGRRVDGGPGRRRRGFSERRRPVSGRRMSPLGAARSGRARSPPHRHRPPARSAPEPPSAAARPGGRGSDGCGLDATSDEPSSQRGPSPRSTCTSPRRVRRRGESRCFERFLQMPLSAHSRVP